MKNAPCIRLPFGQPLADFRGCPHLNVEIDRGSDLPEEIFRFVRPLHRLPIRFFHDQKIDVAVGVRIPEKARPIKDNVARHFLAD